MSGFNDTLTNAEENARNRVSGIRAAFNSLDGITFGFTGSLFNGSFNVTMPVLTMAGGGMLNAGSMFLAGEAGPEVVGRIGNRSAVVNQPQMVDAISGGVAQGMGRANEETDALLSQAVNLLSQILQKTGHFQPSAAMGRVIKQSSEMYARSGG